MITEEERQRIQLILERAILDKEIAVVAACEACLRLNKVAPSSDPASPDYWWQRD